ncbi:MAG: hypothetical protein IJ870_06270 [Alphaproteobacteria bacterium]|nr:hypothetical protein [Alphaproteobacteria bacterium]
MHTDYLLMLIIFLPLIGSIFVLTAKDNHADTFKNAEQVTLLTLLVNILLIITLFSAKPKAEIQADMLAQASWHFFSFIKFSFGADVLALIFVFAAQTALFVGVFGIRKEKQNQKNILFYSLIYLTFLNGYFFALDIMSFYICFVAPLFPLYMLIGYALPERQHKILMRLSFHHFLGAMLLLASCIFILSLKHDDILLSNIDKLHLSYRKSLLVWGGLFLALILRMPVWPFHHATTSVWSALKNPLVFLTLHILPISGIYGFMRCWPLNIPYEISVLTPVFQALCIVTMIFAAFGGYAYTNAGHKLSNYIFVYDLLYLLAVFLPTDVIKLNIAYSVFAFLLITSSLVILQAHMLRESARLNLPVKGILCQMPRASIAYNLFVLAALGLPVSAFFGNNFIIVSEIFNFQLYVGTIVVVCMTLAAISLLHSLYVLKDETCVFAPEMKIKDIDFLSFIVIMIVMFMLLMSLIKPLWFVL